MAHLKIRTLKRKNLAYGKFKYVILFRRKIRDHVFERSNAGEIEKMRDLIKSSFTGPHRFIFKMNNKRRRVYTHLYVVNPMDLALLKLVHLDSLFKIYKIEINLPDEPSLDHDQNIDVI